MNETLKQLYERKSLRAYENKPIPQEVKNQILEAALQAPTAGNMALYTILDITDQQIKDRLAVTCDNQPFIAEAPMVLVFCADYHRWYELFCKYVDEVRTPAEGDLLLANADAIIAAQNTVVAAESFGIGSCYIGDITENYEVHKELLNLPDYVVPACMLCFGYPTKQQKNRQKPGRFTIDEIVHENGYNNEKALQMEAMLNRRNDAVEPEGDENETLTEWIKRFCKRKWNSDFSVEMSRSCRALIDDWCKK